MRRAKRVGRNLLALSLIGYAATALSVLMIPLAIDGNGNLTAAGYTAGSMFWLGLIFGLVFFILAWKKVHNEPFYQKIKSWFGPGAFSFGRNRPALISDILCGISLIALILGNTIWHFPDLVTTGILIIFVLTFLWHFVLNGRVYTYTHHKRQQKTQTRKQDPLNKRKERETT